MKGEQKVITKKELDEVLQHVGKMIANARHNLRDNRFEAMLFQVDKINRDMETVMVNVAEFCRERRVKSEV